ncbi:MAG: hypothetical protein ACLUBL_02810 [Fusobacterium sp.]|uniref:hypothetical protein n=1 Tax=Fusobacterium sp. TaxID=68766 RepID=UPI003991DCBD
MSKLTEAQEKAMQNYRKKNPEKMRYNSYKSTSKTFIRNYSTLEDLEELKKIILERETFLKSEN